MKNVRPSVKLSDKVCQQIFELNSGTSALVSTCISRVTASSITRRCTTLCSLASCLTILTRCLRSIAGISAAHSQTTTSTLMRSRSPSPGLSKHTSGVIRPLDTSKVLTSWSSACAKCSMRKILSGLWSWLSRLTCLPITTLRCTVWGRRPPSCRKFSDNIVSCQRYRQSLMIPRFNSTWWTMPFHGLYLFTQNVCLSRPRFRY